MRAFLLFIAVVGVAAAPLAAQVLTIDITASTAPADILTLQDIDFVNATTPKWLFTIQLTVRGGQAGEQVDAVMRLSLDVALSTGESFPNASTLQTTQFTIQGTRAISNLDLRNSSLVAEYHLDETAKRRFEQIALPTGILPAGVYTFGIAVTNLRTRQITSSSFRFVLSNPSRVELVFPMDNDRSVGQFPLFQWTFDGPRSRISVFEKLPGQSSPEEAASGVPHLSTDVSGTSFLYPSAGARQLEPGKTYVWFVEGLLNTAGNVSSNFKSPIRSFSIAAGGGNAAIQTLLDELEKALGPKHKELFDRIRSEALSPTGEIRVDGTAITTTELVKLIDLFRSKPAGVLSVDIE